MKSSPIVHIGYPKCASTWLQSDVFPLFRRRLYQKIGSPLWGELDKLLYQERYQAGRLSDAVASAPHPVILSREGVVFSGRHRTSLRAGRKEIAERLKSELPGARILIVTRNQQSLVLSVYRQYIHRGGTVPFGRWLGGSSAGYTVDPAQYDFYAAVCEYMNLFGRENVLVLPYELLLERPDMFLEGLASFSGEENLFVGQQARRRNASLSPKGVALLRTWNKWFRRSIHNTQPPLPLPFPSRHRGLFQKLVDPILIHTGSSEPSEDRALAEAFAAMFSSSNQELEALLRMDLRRLGYTV